MKEININEIKVSIQVLRANLKMLEDLLDKHEKIYKIYGAATYIVNDTNNLIKEVAWYCDQETDKNIEKYQKMITELKNREE